MTGDEAGGAGLKAGEDEVRQEAPSARARALREEIFGSALTLDEVSYVLSLDRTTVAKYLREQMIRGFQIGREWLVPEEELRAYVRRMAEQRREEAEAPAPVGGEIRSTERSDWDPFRFLGGATGRRPGKDQSRQKEGRWDRFTERARRVLIFAQEEALRLNHPYIGTEHVLLGLLREGEGVAALVLGSFGVDLAAGRGAVEAMVGPGDHPAVGPASLTARVKKVIELSVDEARRMGHHYVGTEHLLLGLMREDDGVGAGVLHGVGLTYDRLRAATLARLERGPARQAEERERPAPPPEEAAELLRDADTGLTCPRCRARTPLYFRHCFNCGERLAAV